MNVEFNPDQEPTPEAKYELSEYFDLEVSATLNYLCTELSSAHASEDREAIETYAKAFRVITEKLTQNPDVNEESRNRTPIGVQVLTALIYKEAGKYEQYKEEMHDALIVADAYSQEKESYLDVVYWIEDKYYPEDLSKEIS